MKRSVSKCECLILAGLLVAVLGLAACAAPAAVPGDTPTPVPLPSLAPTAGLTSEPPAASPTQAPTVVSPTARIPSRSSPELPGAEIIVPPAVRRAVDEAWARLAKQLGVPPDQIRLVSAEMVNWPDASLGCPEPGMMYAQVVTPGFKAVFEVGGQEVTFHGDLSGRIVECEGGVPVATRASAQAAGAASAEAAAKLASRELAAELGVPAAEVEVVGVEPVEWRDSSLGCPKPGEFYLQVITPGYLVTLSAGGEQYEVHTDRGQRAVVCRSPE